MYQFWMKDNVWTFFFAYGVSSYSFICCVCDIVQFNTGQKNGTLRLRCIQKKNQKLFRIVTPVTPICGFSISSNNHNNNEGFLFIFCLLSFFFELYMQLYAASTTYQTMYSWINYIWTDESKSGLHFFVLFLMKLE